MTTIVVRRADPTTGLPLLEAAVELPPGYYRVLSGAVEAGDRHLSATLFVQDGLVEWRDVDRFPRAGQPYSAAHWFTCLIRRGQPVEQLCPRCHDAPVAARHRYCVECCQRLVEVSRA